MHDLIEANYVSDYRIECVFDDGKRGVVDFAKYIELGGIFEKLAELEYFRQFQVNCELGTLVWPNEADIAPETLYADATGSPLPEWMNRVEKTVN